MKQSDLFSIILVASVGAFGAFFVCQTLMANPDEASVKFKTVREVISSAVVFPDAEVFNITAINPTVEVHVGDCEDVDGNGILDDAELESCRRIEAVTGDENEDEEGGDTNGEEPTE